MSHTVLANRHLQCDECDTVRNEPFCPVCFTPDSGVGIRPKYDGLDGLTVFAAEQIEETPDVLDVVDIFEGKGE